MDTIGKLVLNNDGINVVHKNYIDALKKTTEYNITKERINYIPGIRSLVMSHRQVCDYCNNKEKTNAENTYFIKLCINIGVQICRKCLEQDKHHISFLHYTLCNDQISLWQFQSLNKDNSFISTISYDKVYKNLVRNDDKEYKINTCAPIFISRKRKKNLTFPVYIKNSDEDYFDVTHIQEITLDTFCMFHSSLDKKEIIKRIKKYLTVV